MTATYFGMNPPFFGGAQNVLSRQEDERLIKNDILQLLLTVPGERVMRPDFGVNLRNFVFEQLTQADIFSLQTEIESQVSTQEPRVNVERVEIVRDDDNNGLIVRVVVNLHKDPKRRFTVEQFIQMAVDSQIQI